MGTSCRSQSNLCIGAVFFFKPAKEPSAAESDDSAIDAGSRPLQSQTQQTSSPSLLCKGIRKKACSCQKHEHIACRCAQKQGACPC
eukprot:1157613-Pelagomonas_calceolata.AAC.8